MSQRAAIFDINMSMRAVHCQSRPNLISCLPVRPHRDTCNPLYPQIDILLNIALNMSNLYTLPHASSLINSLTTDRKFAGDNMLLLFFFFTCNNLTAYPSLSFTSHRYGGTETKEYCTAGLWLPTFLSSKDHFL